MLLISIFTNEETEIQDGERQSWDWNTSLADSEHALAGISWYQLDKTGLTDLSQMPENSAKVGRNEQVPPGIMQVEDIRHPGKGLLGGSVG